MKKGEMGWITQHADGMYLQPVEVMILSTDTGGVHCVKVQTKTGKILYCRPDQIKSRKAKAERAADPAVPQEIHDKAAELAEAKIQKHKAKAEKPKPEKKEENMTIITEKEAAKVAAEKKERKKYSFEDFRNIFRSLETAEAMSEETASLVPIVEMAKAQIMTEYAEGWNI